MRRKVILDLFFLDLMAILLLFLSYDQKYALVIVASMLLIVGILSRNRS